MSKKFEIRNSTAEFRIFQIKGKKDGVQVVSHNESVWCTQKTMAKLFDVGIPAISQHPNNILKKKSSDSIQLFPKWKKLTQIR